MQLIGTRFGTLNYQPDSLIHFPEGLIGLPLLRQFVMLPHGSPESAFTWLQSVEEPALAFLVADPWRFFPDYAPTLPASVVEQLALDRESHAVMTTAHIPAGQPQEMTLNLAAPVVINAVSRVGKQVVAEGDAYTIKQRVFPGTEAQAEKIAA